MFGTIRGNPLFHVGIIIIMPGQMAFSSLRCCLLRVFLVFKGDMRCQLLLELLWEVNRIGKR
jgi:hypothetical protein